jgi:uncharacterized protein (TIGR03435 family)
MDSVHYDIDAKPSTPFQPTYDTRPYAMQMVQKLLEDRFQLSIQRTSKDLPLYVLSIGEDGAKLKAREKAENPSDMKMSGGKGLMIGQDVPMPSIFTAIQEQLGLKLEARRGLVEVLVIESATQPSEN